MRRIGRRFLRDSEQGRPYFRNMFSIARVAAFALCLLAAKTAAGQILSLSGTIDVTDPTQSGRLIRNSIPSVAGTLKPFPGLNDSTVQRHFDLVTFVNPDSTPTDFVFTLTQPTTSLFFVAYLGSFNPASIATNYLADPGSSLSTSVFSVTVPAGATVALVIHEVNANGALGTGYNVTVDRLVVVPEPGTVGAGLLVLGLAGHSLWRRRSTRAA